MSGFTSLRWQTAKPKRGHYTCTDCGCLIVTGKRYAYAVGKIEGGFTWYRYCAMCIFRNAARYGTEKGWQPTGVPPELTERQRVELAYLKRFDAAEGR